MDRTILVTGGNSDIGTSLIKQLRLMKSVRIISTRNAGESIVDIVDKECVVDFSRISPSELNNIFRDENITDLVTLHGMHEADDTFLNENNSPDLMNVNLFSVINLAKLCFPKMLENKFGRMIFVGTASAQHGGGKHTFSYGLSKSGLTYLSQHLAKYYSSDGILINSISPGFVDTELTRRILDENEIEKLIDTIPQNRLADASEIAKIVIFLSSNHNTYITGQNIIVDGGYTSV